MVNGVKILLFLVCKIVLSAHNDNRKKGILVLNEGPTDVLDDSAIMTEAKYFVKINKSRKKIYLSLHYKQPTVICMQMTRRFINSKQMTLKQNHIHRPGGIFQKYFIVKNMKKNPD